jgi:hypothetical protein
MYIRKKGNIPPFISCHQKSAIKCHAGRQGLLFIYDHWSDSLMKRFFGRHSMKTTCLISFIILLFLVDSLGIGIVGHLKETTNQTSDFISIYCILVHYSESHTELFT